ncbi:MAG: DUF2066 domain-containing protein [Pseudomonadota bacterium]|nr:DUF2066 domain-containing protein [Pseudomonadota bacterium]
MGAIAASLGGTAFATARVELFQATAPVADRSEAARNAAFQAALKGVLVRVTGRRTAGEDPAFAPLFNSAPRYVQQYRTAPDSKLWVAFDGAAIERWLTQNGQPSWGRERPTTLVWLSVQDGSQPGTVLSADDTSELKAAIDAAAEIRGIPLVWPSAAVAAAAAPAAAEMARRAGADAVLVGRATSADKAAGVRWSLLFQDRSSEFSGTLEGINRAADLYAGLFAASGSVAPIDIEVSGVADLRDYANVQTYLESLTFITHVGVQALNGDSVTFRLGARGGIEPLQHAIALNGRLQPQPAGDNGIQRFQLRR